MQTARTQTCGSRSYSCLSILYLRCLRGLPSCCANTASSLSILYLRCPGAETRSCCAQQDVLSILYLRCGVLFQTTALGYLSKLSILYLRCTPPAEGWAGRGPAPFNSLFEMQSIYLGDYPAERRGLSILYLRCYCAVWPHPRAEEAGFQFSI